VAAEAAGSAAVEEEEEEAAEAAAVAGAAVKAAALKNAPSQVRVRVPWWWANKVPSQTQTARDLSALETVALALSLSP
jgi:hypothetical protein